MTTELTTVGTKLIEEFRGVALTIADRQEIVRGLSAAEGLRAGLVITSKEQAAEVADAVATVIDGEKALAAEVSSVLLVPKRMETAVRSAVAPFRERLQDARQVGNAARLAWQETLRREAAREEEKRRQAAQEAAQRAAEEAALAGDDIPPPAEVAPVEVPKTVAGGMGKQGIQVRIEVVAVADWKQVPQGWLVLNEGVARGMFLAAERNKEIQKPAPGESIVWNGVRFTAIESVVNRR